MFSGSPLVRKGGQVKGLSESVLQSPENRWKFDNQENVRLSENGDRLGEPIPAYSKENPKNLTTQIVAGNR